MNLFSAGYDVWAQAITSLADIGYDSNSMVALPYDWRLSIPNLEQRDAYYSRLRSQVRSLSRAPPSHIQFSTEAQVAAQPLADRPPACDTHLAAAI